MLNKKMTKKTHGQRISWNIIVVYNNIKPRPFGNLRGRSVWVARRTRTVENFIITRHFSRSHSNFLLIFFNNFCIQWKVENTLHKAAPTRAFSRVPIYLFTLWLLVLDYGHPLDFLTYYSLTDWYEHQTPQFTLSKHCKLIHSS